MSADISMLHIFSSFLWKSIVGLNTEDDDHIWPLYNWGIHTCCFSSSTTDNVRPVHDRFTKMATLPRAGNLQVCYIHTLGLSWRASFFSLPICYRSGKTAVNCFDAQQHFFLLPHIWVMIKKKNDFMNHSMIISVFMRVSSFRLSNQINPLDWNTINKCIHFKIQVMNKIKMMVKKR